MTLLDYVPGMIFWKSDIVCDHFGHVGDIRYIYGVIKGECGVQGRSWWLLCG